MREFVDYVVIARNGTEDGHERRVTFENVAKDAPESVRRSRDEFSPYLGCTYREHELAWAGEDFRNWHAVNFCAELAERSFEIEDIRDEYAWFLSSASFTAYVDALRDGKDGLDALEAALKRAGDVNDAFKTYMLPVVNDLVEDIKEMAEELGQELKI